MSKLRLIVSIGAAALLSAYPASAQIMPPEPGGTDTPGQVAEMARMLCEGDAYTALGYASYPDCYNDIVQNFQPAGGQGNGGDLAWCRSFSGKTGIPCFA
jgi:hypothetical protein